MKIEGSEPPEALARPRNGQRVLLKGGSVLSLDEKVGDHDCADVLVRGDRIEAVGPALADEVDDSDVVTVDATGLILLPGFQDAHRHCWQGQFRRLLPSCDVYQYVETTHGRLGPAYTPDDIYAGCALSAWSSIDAGITSVLDFMHNTRTLEHGLAAIAAFDDAKVRCIHASSPAVSGEWDRRWLPNVREIAAQSRGSLVTLRLGPFGDPSLDQPGHIVSAELMAFACELGIGVTVDASIGPVAGDHIRDLARAGELGPDVTILHCTGFRADAWRAMADAGLEVALCPTSDAQIGLGDAVPPLQPALDHGFHPALSVDVECSLSTDMFAQMQAIYTIQRMHAFQRAEAGDPDAPAPVDVSEILRLATIDGARANGLEATTGSLTPGKQADLIAIDAEAINTMPLNHAAGTVVLGADSRNVRLVFVAGQLRKWNDRLVGCNLDALRDHVHASRDRLAAEVGLPLQIV
jgi:cytosine/adenosine deaminase-related metal-dependent hydrolase